jgi:fructosamine-3-kinase
VAEGLVAEGVLAHLGERLRSVRPLGGGCIGEVYRAELDDGTPLVAKVDRGGEAHLDREAYMLRYLRERTDLPVPEVFHGSETLLLMEFVEGTSRFSREAERHGAELLAALHGITADAYGHERDTLIGSLDQPNPRTASWTDFFRDNRLLYAARAAHGAGRLPDEDLGRVARLADRLEDLIEEPNPPALIHGDAWSGNVLAKGGRISAFLDPAIYHADPEIELAFISLFNSFGEAFMQRYDEIRPIRDGFFETRRDLYNLYPLLIHTYYFGGGYLGSVRRALDRFGV